ncbi:MULTISPECIES: hypothetical protein [unclassified Moorena]|uniref:hypothetical protein n=1 Tax=unclassified Moorena TaxID=2683338 RepID=UPI0025F849BC|nr:MULTISPECIES: hypothetical protein [unclassified Moorena]
MAKRPRVRVQPSKPWPKGHACAFNLQTLKPWPKGHACAFNCQNLQQFSLQTKTYETSAISSRISRYRH